MHSLLLFKMISFCFKSDENGNCLLSAVSVVMSGNNRYIDDLRILASIEMNLNSEFYAKHTSFVTVVNSHSGVFNPLLRNVVKRSNTI